MGKITEEDKWEESVYLIEKQDKVLGGVEGVVNIQAKHLTDRTVYLRRLLTEAGQRLTPKKITATSRNINDSTGHTHEIDLASLTKKGLVQLTNDTGLESESLALTAKGAKKLASEIASVQQLANGKYSERPASTSQTGTVQLNNTLTSTSTTQALTAAQGKALNDKLNVFKVPSKNATAPVVFDLANREHWIAEIGEVYKNGVGQYQLNLHNNANSTITNLPLEAKGLLQLDIYIAWGFSFIRCHYLYLNRTFTTSVNWNQATLTLNWFEELKVDSKGKVSTETAFANPVEAKAPPAEANNDQLPTTAWVRKWGEGLFSGVYQRMGSFDIFRYPDGMMIQSGYFSFAGTALTSGAMQQKLSLTFPLAFYSRTPRIFFQPASARNNSVDSSGVADIEINTLPNESTTTHTVFLAKKQTPYIPVDTGLSVLVIGRWK